MKAIVISLISLMGLSYSLAAMPMPRPSLPQDAAIDRFIDSAKRGDLNELIVQIRQVTSVNAGDKWGTTALHAACVHGHTLCVKALIGSGANVNVANIYGRTALHFAAGNGHMDCLKAVVKAGALLNFYDGVGRTAHHLSSINDQPDCLIALIKYSYLLVPSPEVLLQARNQINPSPEDKGIIFIADLNEEKEIPAIDLSGLKESAVSYILTRLPEVIAADGFTSMDPGLISLLESTSLARLVREGLDERVEELLAKAIRQELLKNL